jgi:hypothetical protein
MIKASLELLLNHDKELLETRHFGAETCIHSLQNETRIKVLI